MKLKNHFSLTRANEAKAVIAIAAVAVTLGLETLSLHAAQAVTLASFERDLQPLNPPPGWSYLWNSAGAIGNPLNYTRLLPVTASRFYYTGNGNPPPAPAPAAFVYIGLDPFGNPGGHAGLGSNRIESGGIERFAIAAYILSTSNSIAITNGLLTNVDPSATSFNSDGLSLQVYVNSTLIVNTFTAPGFNNSADFSADLGNLNAGDTIYVAVGGRNADFYDAFRLQYSIEAVEAIPESEPFTILSTSILVGLGVLSKKQPLKRKYQQKV